MSGHVTRMFCAVAAGFALIVSGLATACAAGAVSAARPSLSGRTAQSTTTIVCCGVSAVAVTSARNAWAVGGGPRTVILHWTGAAWERCAARIPPRATARTSLASRPHLTGTCGWSAMPVAAGRP
jgi:hypothetical protein